MYRHRSYHPGQRRVGPGESIYADGCPAYRRRLRLCTRRAGEGVVALSLLLFAFSSILGWSYYGQQCLRYLSGGDRLLPAYRTVFLACTLAGALWEPGAIWLLVDLSNALMALPNLAALLMLAPEALSTLRQWTELRHANLTSILPFHQRNPHHDML